MKLREHEITLRGETVVLRPMTEDDWDVLLKWNSDPDVLYSSESADVTLHSLEQVQQIYRVVSQNAFCFIIEVDSRPIGECWLQDLAPRGAERQEAVDGALRRDPGVALRSAGPSAPLSRGWNALADGCTRAVYSTPRSPEDHAKDIRRAVDRCPH